MAMKLHQAHQSNLIDPIGSTRPLLIAPAAVAALGLLFAAPPALAGDTGEPVRQYTQSNLSLSGPVRPIDDDDDDEDEIPFDVADVYAELNNTDGDLGFHALIDGDAWKRLEIEDPNERKLLNVNVRGSLRKQGLTELFFESAEPPFDELTPEEFFARFAEGEYEIEGKTLDGEELESTDLFWHVMPAPAEPTVNRQAMAEVCDEGDPNYDVTVTGSPVTIAWDPVTTNHPEIGAPGEIIPALYQVVVEAELEVDGEEFTSVFSVELPPDATAMTIPQEVIELSDSFKYEVLVKEKIGGNQVAVESCFIIE
ncbi:MAG: hypothetical protein V2J55_16720 [Candidatus Competibacteraceae bacterium]|jgi:hypothetical protein|nr:hypothetical protein [Candidatus Competibacteraceae bacterium]